MSADNAPSTLWVVVDKDGTVRYTDTSEEYEDWRLRSFDNAFPRIAPHRVVAYVPVPESPCTCGPHTPQGPFSIDCPEHGSPRAAVPQGASVPRVGLGCDYPKCGSKNPCYGARDEICDTYAAPREPDDLCLCTLTCAGQERIVDSRRKCRNLAPREPVKAEPVAWMYRHDDGFTRIAQLYRWPQPVEEWTEIPLYAAQEDKP